MDNNLCIGAPLVDTFASTASPVALSGLLFGDARLPSPGSCLSGPLPRWWTWPTGPAAPWIRRPTSRRPPC